MENKYMGEDIGWEEVICVNNRWCFLYFCKVDIVFWKRYRCS